MSPAIRSVLRRLDHESLENWGVLVVGVGAAFFGLRLFGSGSVYWSSVLVLAGIYQLTSLKRVCLTKCRAPQDFILHFWGKGYSGSFRMGL